MQLHRFCRYPEACMLGLLLTVFSLTSLQADILDQWYWRNPTPSANSLRSLCFGVGKFVAVGDGGVIHTSLDGVTWDDGRRPAASIWRKVVFANGLFVAVGHDGAVATSADGYLWTKRASGTTNMLFAIACENGRYVACGEAGQVTISADGLNWTAGTVGTNDLKWIAAGNGVFILPMPNQQMAVRVSSDLQTWSTATFPNAVHMGLSPHYLFEAQFGNGQFVAAVQDEVLVGTWQPDTHFYRSTDGTNWAQGAEGGSSVNQYRFLNYVNGSFHQFAMNSIPGSSGTLFRSLNGTACTYSQLPSDMYDASGLSYGNGRYVMPGIAGKTWTSTNATNWNSNYSGLRASFYQLLRGGSNYVLLAGGQRILLSADGLSFVPATNSPAGVLSSAAFDGSNYVAVGVSGLGLPGFTGEVYASTNSTDWVRRTSNANQPLTAVCRGAARWIAVGENGTVITSPNALAWTLRASGTANRLNGVAFGNGVHVAVGNLGTIITSPDGTAWDVQFSGTTANLNRVRFLNGLFISVGANGSVLTSSDGAVWSSQTVGTTRSLTDVAFGDGHYVVCGSDNVILNTIDPTLFDHYFSTTFNVILRSTNAVNWEDVTTRVPAQVGLNSIAFIDDSFWLSGECGALLQSDSVGGIPRLAGQLLPDNAGFQIKVTINVPASYRLQTSTNLAANSWEDIAVGTNSTRQTVFVDSSTAGFTRKFYRLASP